MTFVFHADGDNKGNFYLNCYSNIDTNADVCINDKNHILRGNPKIIARVGDSKFGEEIVFQFLIKEIKETYEKVSKYDTIEYYLPLEEGIKFLEKSLGFLRKKLEERNG